MHPCSTPRRFTAGLVALFAALAIAAPAIAQPPCAEDTFQPHFGAGSLMSGVYLSLTGDGEVILAPTLATEFSGASLDASWADFPWSGGGGSVVGGGVLTVDGSRVNSEPASGFGPGSSLEFVATFDATPFQHVGFGAGNDIGPGEIFNTNPWAIFSTRVSGAQLHASVWSGVLTDIALPAVTLGVAHHFRIDWQPASIDFYVDGALVHSEPAAIAGPMRPAASDFNVGGAVLVVDWMRLSPYVPVGTFESRVFDAGAPTGWLNMTWTSVTPPGTVLAMFARAGNTPTPDGTWTPWVIIPASGASVGLTSRYIQYRASLSTVDFAVTPALLDVRIACDFAVTARGGTWGELKLRYR